MLKLSEMKKCKLIPSILICAVLVLATSCSSTGVMSIGSNTYMVSKSSKAGAFANTAKLKAGVIREANEYASARGKVAQGISIKEMRPVTGFPSVEYQFSLVNPDGTGGSSLPMPERVTQVQAR
jgi:hypothetical protein